MPFEAPPTGQVMGLPVPGNGDLVAATIAKDQGDSIARAAQIATRTPVTMESAFSRYV